VAARVGEGIDVGAREHAKGRGGEENHGRAAMVING
jgi:hypothetical protein